MNILGIETSCDETAAAVVQDGRLVRSNVIASQIELHRAHGGVVPELAARAQVTAIVPVIEEALQVAGLTLPEADAIAVTQGPGLAGSLLVGVNTAKALAWSLDRPLIPINHLEAHVYANWLHIPGDEELPPPAFPALCLLVSGGHTELVLMTDHAHYQVLGETLDDAAGEAFDKGARLIGLGYPGGPAIQRAAEGGDPDAFALPRAWLGERDDFSFSGLKTALLHVVEPYRLPDPEPAPVSDGPFPVHHPPVFRADLPVADLAASFEAAIVEVLAVKTARAARRHGVASVLLAGGVAANRALRQRLLAEVTTAFVGETPPAVRWPRIALCTDNGAMVGGLAFRRYAPDAARDLRVDALPRFPIAAGQSAVGSDS